MSPAADGTRRPGGLRTRWVGPLWRWHRRAGVLAALVLIFLATTGLLLNHTDDLGLEDRPVHGDWVYRMYGANAAGHWQAFRADDRWVLQNESGDLFVEHAPASPCEGRLVGAVARPDYLVVACEHALMLLDRDGAIIDSLGSATGLPGTLSALASRKGALYARLDGTWRGFDADLMTFGGTPTHAPHPIEPAEAPRALRAALDEAASWLDWERLLLDLHSGRLFGRYGVLVVDLAGVLSILLALSGLAIWGLRTRR